MFFMRHIYVFFYFFFIFMPNICVHFIRSTDVYCLGWLFKLEVKNMDELKALKDEKAYAEYLTNKDDSH